MSEEGKDEIKKAVAEIEPPSERALAEEEVRADVEYDTKPKGVDDPLARIITLGYRSSEDPVVRARLLEEAQDELSRWRDHRKDLFARLKTSCWALVENQRRARRGEAGIEVKDSAPPYLLVRQLLLTERVLDTSQKRLVRMRDHFSRWDQIKQEEREAAFAQTPEGLRREVASLKARLSAIETAKQG